MVLGAIQPEERNQIQKYFYVIIDLDTNITHIVYSKSKIVGGDGSPNDNLKAPCGVRINNNRIAMLYNQDTTGKMVSQIQCSKCKEHMQFELDVLDKGVY